MSTSPNVCLGQHICLGLENSQREFLALGELQNTRAQKVAFKLGVGGGNGEGRTRRGAGGEGRRGRRRGTADALVSCAGFPLAYNTTEPHTYTCSHTLSHPLTPWVGVWDTLW